MSSNKVFWVIIAGFLLAILLSWLSIHHIVKQQPDQQASKATEPSSIINNANYVHTNDQGKVTETLIAPKIIHFDKNDSSTLIEPTVTLYGNKAPWVITAKTGYSYHGSEKIILKDDVKIRQHNKDGDTILTTTEATIWPKKKFASTEALVTIIQPGSSVQGKGMTVDMETGDVHLLNSARGQYEPSKSSDTSKP